ncbi:MAG TPA: hypothetical protein VKB78_15860 [Pirellulales bacterium]|nr:hypothetical protein [Pirellulales bacterium]
MAAQSPPAVGVPAANPGQSFAPYPTQQSAAPQVPYPGTLPPAAPLAYQGVVPAQAAVYPPPVAAAPEQVYPPPTAYPQPTYPPPVAVPAPVYQPPPAYVAPQQGTADANVCIPYSPRWVFGAEALWLERTDDRDVLLGNTVMNNGGPPFIVNQLTSGDELFPMETGIKLSLGYRMNDRNAIEVIYWGLQHWSVSREIQGDPIGESVLAFSPWTQTDTLIGGFDTTLGYTYSSQVNNAEVNERFAGTGGLTWSIAGLWGIRYLQVSDRFNLHGTDTATADFENIDVKTTNSLLGPQVGVEFVRDWGKFQLNTELKAGLFGNLASENYSNLNSSGALFGSPAGFVPVSASHSGTTAAGVFEFNLIARYQISQHFWIRGAWNDYWIAGLALGPRQLGHFNTDGAISLDGPSIGLEAAW